MAGRQDGIGSRSLQFRLSVWLVAAIVAVAALGAVYAYGSAYDEAIELQDDQLREVATLVSSSPRATALQPVVAADETGEADPRISIGQLSVDGHGLPSQLRGLPPMLDGGFHTLALGGVEWRVFVVVTARTRLVVAQRTAVRDDVAHDGALRALVPFLVLIPVLLIMVGAIVRRVFKPLRALAAEVDARTDVDVGAIPDAGLPSEIQPLVRAINRLLGRVDRAMATQGRFIADAAHELRSPMAALTLQVELLGNTDMPEKAHRRVETLADGLRRARALLDQLLTLARMRQTPPPGQAITRVGHVLRTVSADHIALADSKRIDLGVVGDPDVDVPMDEADLSTVLRNLVDNALRYTPPGGRVDLVVRPAGNRICLSVEDTGPGIPAAIHDQVFAPFYRVANDSGGSGLGLSIVKAIVDRYGATITIGDRADGTSVTVEFSQAHGVA